MNSRIQTFTITFGDQAENNVGMQKIGSLSNDGFSYEDLSKMYLWFEENGIVCELYNLKCLIDNSTNTDNYDDAYMLIVRNGLDVLLNPHTADDFYVEQNNLEKDTKAYMYGRVVNKNARHNLCFGHISQEPNYEQKMGRIVSFDSVPILNHLRLKFEHILGDKGKNLVAEGNYYYDITKTGISFHGDTERRKVIGVRLGATLPLHFHWFYQNKPVGSRAEFLLNHGDIYVMSEKTTGNDWKKRNTPTLRHAAGAKKYLTIK